MKTEVAHKIPLITLVGQPNSGKTTLFNHLSGKKYKTVNYPGSTVEYSISKVLPRFSLKANVLDSPGIISLEPVSPDEVISVNSLFAHPKYGTPDLVVVTADASQLSRHLLLVRQLMDSGFRVVVAVTMSDILRKKRFGISVKKLSEILGCRVVIVNGLSGVGLEALAKEIDEELKFRELSGISEKKPERHIHDNLIDSYNEAEKIEKEVLYELPMPKSFVEFDPDKVNSELVVLGNSDPRNRPDEFTLKLDRFVLHKYFGLLIFVLIMGLTFTSIFWLAAPAMDLVNEFFSFLSDKTEMILGDNWFSDLVSNGFINGLGSVLVFVPQILILFLILGLLEDSGYLARGAMLVDKPLSKIGLNGKSFVPMLSGFACAIPAIMAARTITNRRERLLTIFIIPLMSCSARLPVYALLIAFLTPAGKPWIGGITLTAVYIFSIVSSLIIASVVNRFKGTLIKETDDSSFILELPAYRRPKLGVVFSNTVKNAKQYVKKAGPVILQLSLVLWLLTNLPNYSPAVDTAGKTEEEISSVRQAERISSSYAASLGKVIEPLMKPMGMDWRVGVSLIATFAAREVFVSSLALTFHITDSEESLQSSLLSSMRNATFEDSGKKIFTTASTAGLIVFFVFALQCLSTVAISRKETGGWRIPMLQIFIFTSIGYILSIITVNGLRALGVN